MRKSLISCFVAAVLFCLPGLRAEGAEGGLVTLQWHATDIVDVYLNGRPLRNYDPSFKTRPNEGDKPPFKAYVTLQDGDVFTVGGHRGGTFGFMLIALDSAGKLIFATDSDHWQAYLPGNKPDWFQPAVAKEASKNPLGIQSRLGKFQKELSQKSGNKAQSIWGRPSDKFAYLVGTVSLK